MRIKICPLNDGETYCCQISNIKECFNQTEISINFGNLGKNFRFDSGAKKNNIKGKIICSLSINCRDCKSSYFNLYHKPILSFYALKNEEFSDALKKDFANKILPQIMEWFNKNKDGQHFGNYKLLVEFIEQKLIIHTNYSA